MMRLARSKSWLVSAKDRSKGLIRCLIAIPPFFIICYIISKPEGKSKRGREKRRKNQERSLVICRGDKSPSSSRLAWAGSEGREGAAPSQTV